MSTVDSYSYYHYFKNSHAVIFSSLLYDTSFIKYVWVQIIVINIVFNYFDSIERKLVFRPCLNQPIATTLRTATLFTVKKTTFYM